MRTEEGLSSGHVFGPFEIALLDEGLCRCRKIALEVQQRVSRKLRVATFRFKGGGGGEDIEQVRALPVGGGTDAWAILAGSTPLAFRANNTHQFPSVWRENLFPAGQLVKQVTRTRSGTGVPMRFCLRGKTGRERRWSRLRRRDLIEGASEGEEERTFRRSNRRDLVDARARSAALRRGENVPPE